jgi:hypothetical protein
MRLSRLLLMLLQYVEQLPSTVLRLLHPQLLQLASLTHLHLVLARPPSVKFSTDIPKSLLRLHQLPTRITILQLDLVIGIALQFLIVISSNLLLLTQQIVLSQILQSTCQSSAHFLLLQKLNLLLHPLQLCLTQLIETLRQFLLHLTLTH